jgi:3-oxoacyl-[acyl-carrier protein] reductase
VERGDRVGIGTRASDVPGAFRFDVADFAAVEAAFEEFAKGAGLDAVVVNAAIAPTGILATADPGDLRRIVDTNVLGPLHCARAALPIMMRQRKGLLVFVGSVAASRPARGQAAYASSKGAVESLTRAIAVEYGRKGIRAICIRPGAVDTDMLKNTRNLAENEVLERIPMKRIAAADEIARTVLLFLGEQASYVNGAIIDVDGGYAAG